MYDYEFEVESQQEQDAGPDAEIIKDFHDFAAIEVSEEGIVEIFLVSEVEDAEVTGEIAEEASDTDYKDGFEPACLESYERQDQDRATDHSINQCNYCSKEVHLFFLCIYHTNDDLDTLL